MFIPNADVPLNNFGGEEPIGKRGSKRVDVLGSQRICDI